MSTDAWGIVDGYEDSAETWHDTPTETRAALRAAMGGDAHGPPPGDDDGLLVVRAGQSVAMASPGALRLEDGTQLRVAGALPRDMPPGYHEFRAEGCERVTRVICSPGRCVLPSARYAWGWAAQLYAVRSENSWGIGDFGDLRRLADWSSTLGAGLLQVNPLPACAPVISQQASPYYPTTRRFRNPLYLCIEELPGASLLGERLEALAAQGRALNAERRIDRDAVFRLKHQALELLWDRFAGDAAFEQYRGEQGLALRQFAIYCTLAEAHGGDWRRWPAEYRDPAQAAVLRWAEEHARRVGYHEWLQWLLDEQLAHASADLPIVQDLPIGVDPGGADAWAWQDLLATGCTVGAPPDMYNTLGQDWGLPPLVPHRLRAAGYEPIVQTLRASLRHAGGLRIDHVMGLFRLFWIPHGFGPARGTFVRYRADELLAIVALESHRAGAYVVGEDLGTVEDGVREQLTEHNILGYRLLWFEDDPPAQYPELVMVAATTHDLPTIAGLWSGRDLAMQQALGLEPNAAGVESIRSRLAEMTGLPAAAPATTVVEAAYRLLGEAPSRFVMAMLEDALAVEERANMPGTVDQWPNWSLALPGGLEALRSSLLAQAIAQALDRGTPRRRR